MLIKFHFGFAHKKADNCKSTLKQLMAGTMEISFTKKLNRL